MSNTLVNAAPLVRDFGREDLSTRQLPREPDAIPQHLPKFFTFAERGDGAESLLSGAEREAKYGAASFDLRGKYATHATPFINAVNAAGNAIVYKRIIPEDAGPKANLLLSLDVLRTTVDLYQRNEDGSIATDVLGQPIITGTASGVKTKWVVSHVDSHADYAEFGGRQITNGDQIDPTTSTQSSSYPIFEFGASSQGEYGNRLGIRLWSPNSDTDTMPARLLTTALAYPFNLSVVERPAALTTPVVQKTVFGEQTVQFVVKPNTVDPTTDEQMYIGETYLANYSSESDPRYPVVRAPLGDFKIYQENIDLLLTEFHALEAEYADADSDFTADAGEKYLFNFVGGTDSLGRPYHTFVFVDSETSERLSSFTNLYAAGGSDGTLSTEAFDTAVALEMARYLDKMDEVHDLPRHPESIVYDSGFGVEAKMALASFIGVRKDTFVVVGTHIDGEPAMDASQEHSLAVALRTRLQTFPDSDYFGTPAFRAMIVGRSGRIRNSQWSRRVPLTYEVAVKAARYMGAANGRWRSGSNFDGAPGSVIESVYDINITWVPDSVRNRNWDVGLNWVSAYDLKSFYFPALKTVYTDDTSVLNGFLTAFALCYVNKVAHACHREFSGVSNVTNGQLLDRVNSFVRDRLANRFDARFVIEPQATITDMDAIRGYSWTLPVGFWGPSLKTVQTTYTQVFRRDDLAAAG